MDQLGIVLQEITLRLLVGYSRCCTSLHQAHLLKPPTLGLGQSECEFKVLAVEVVVRRLVVVAKAAVAVLMPRSS
jgi:hypothetical protein